MNSPARDPIRDALAFLGVDRLAFGIHQSAFPASPIDTGFGAPSASAGRRLLAFIAGLGFNTLQLGPDGQISDINHSPYDGTAFARNTLQLDLEALAERGGLLDPDDVERVLAEAAAGEPAARPDPRRADPHRSRLVVQAAMARAHARLIQGRTDPAMRPHVEAFERFRRTHAYWLEADALFEVMAEQAGHADPTRFDPAVQAMLAPTADATERRRSIRATLTAPIERAELAQYIAYDQAAAFHSCARTHGLLVFADLQVGWSRRDHFLRADAFCEGWRLGAPPSRTNPDGQPWGYPVLDPDQLDDPESPAVQLFTERLRNGLPAYDGLRIDHPHGLVCPWIYRADAADPFAALRAGARAFESPDRPEPELVRWAIARVQDLDPCASDRWDERWVRAMAPDQIDRWARLIDRLVEVAREHGIGPCAIAAEVLSTCPEPLRAVLARHGLGRFRVTQKADVRNPADVYRTDRAEPGDWVMLGNHDTAPILAVTERWLQQGRGDERASDLARRLVPDPGERTAAARRFAASPGALAQAHLADLFVSAASNVLIYFSDLFGEWEPFNRPGIVHPDNWTQRVPPDFERVYAARRQRGQALDVHAALATAVRAKGGDEQLARALERRSQAG